jgi:arabinosyltransferase C
LARPLGEPADATVLATARRPDETEALQIALRSDSLAITVGRSPAATVPWPDACPLEIGVRDGELRLPDETVPLRTGTPGDMPIVTGFFTELDLGSGERPEVRLTTRAYATSWTWRQWVAGLLALLLACASLVLLARPDDGYRRRALRPAMASAWRARHATDAVVAAFLLVWWIVAPTFTDDGWIWVEQRVLATDGLDTIYFNNWGLGFPVGYWPVWAGQWVLGAADDLVFVRLPSLALVLAAWALCRWSLSRAVGGCPANVVTWVLGGAFLVGATAWLMTLRVEPLVALLTLIVLAASCSFARAPRLSVVIVALVAAMLAVTAHPVGVLAAAPLLASSPQLARWLLATGRASVVSVAASCIAVLAIGVVLLVVDSDLPTRVANARLVATEDLHNEPFWREYIRYELFDEYGGETAVRRLSLGLLLLAVAFLVTRSRSVSTGVSPLPARSIAIALVLLGFVSSKWPWHFGALAAIGAVALAAEVARLIAESAYPRRFAIARPVIALGGVAVALLWSWPAAREWSKIDLQEAQWTSVFGWERRWTALVVVAVGALVVIVGLRRRRSSSAAAVSLAGGYAIAILTLGAVAGTVAILIWDASSSQWTPARQNLETLAGRQSCGLGDRLSAVGVVDRIADDRTRTLLTPSVGMYLPCATVPEVAFGLVRMPDLVVFDVGLGPWPLDTPHGPFAAVRDLFEVYPVATGPSVEVYATMKAEGGFARADAWGGKLGGEAGPVDG